jgi:hypothetical protein
MKKNFLVIFIVALVTFLSVAVVLALLNYASHTQPVIQSQSTTKLKGLSVLQVGRSNNLLDAVLSKFEAQEATVIRFADPHSILARMAALPEKALVVFDGDWLASISEDREFQTILQRLHEQRKYCAFAAIGGKTSSLFDALDKAGVYKLDRYNGIVRNPAYDNPPVAGLRLKIATTPTGKAYAYPSILISETRDPNTIVEALVSWLGG